MIKTSLPDSFLRYHNHRIRIHIISYHHIHIISSHSHHHIIISSLHIKNIIHNLTLTEMEPLQRMPANDLPNGSGGTADGDGPSSNNGSSRDKKVARKDKGPPIHQRRGVPLANHGLFRNLRPVKENLFGRALAIDLRPVVGFRSRA